MHRTLRHAGTALACLTLSVTTLATAPAVATPDPGPVGDGADWLTAQLTGGLIHNDQYGFDDYGLSVDTGLALQAVGRDATADQVATAVAGHIDSYTTGVDWGSSDVYAGAVGKALVLAQATGADPTSFGGVDLVTRMAARVSTDPGIEGRIEDQTAGTDYANVIGQSFAARGLQVAGSPAAPETVSFLLDQQCDAGFFRLYFTVDKTAAGQGCEQGAAGSEPNVDVTALAYLNLEASGATDPAVLTAKNNAINWLKGRQQADGSFVGGASTAVANANSTGLAAWALHVAGADVRAGKAATWLRAHQIRAVGPCPRLTSLAGGVAYDDAGLTDALANGIPATQQDQWRRASAQAVPGLLAAEQLTSALVATGPTGYVKGGSKVTISVSGAVPGSLCVAGDTRAVPGAVAVDGTGSIRLRVPTTTDTVAYTAADTGAGQDRVRVKVLGPLTIPFTLQSPVAVGDRQVVRARGLASREKVSVFFRGVKVDSGLAATDGTYVSRFPVTGPTGSATVKVTGQFATRTNAKTFRVVR